MAVNRYNHCWTLLEKEHRTSDEDDELLESSFVQHYHWFLAGGPDQFVMADWMVSRAAAATGHGDLALHYAQLAYDRAQTPSTPDWLLASVAEGVARAYATSGDAAQRDHWFAVAKELVDMIVDREDRELIDSQLSSVPR
jgi:hypothetical protein